MKKSVFLIFSAVTILFYGCGGANPLAFRTIRNGHALINASKPASLDLDEDPGVCLPMTTRSSLSIDVECILDYIQGASTFGPEDRRDDLMNPWIRLNLSF